MIAKASGLMSVPDELSSVDAAPLLLPASRHSVPSEFPARAATWSRYSGSAGLATWCAICRHMGFEVVAIDRGADRAELSNKLGAHHYMTAPPLMSPRHSGTWRASVVMATASGGKAVAAGARWPQTRRRVISLGATDEPIELSAFELLFRAWASRAR